MKKKVRRLFFAWQYNKEEAWINQKARDGWALIKVGLFSFVFESCEPNEYLYRHELLEKDFSSKESQDYIQFLESTGIEMIGHRSRWVYFRKKASEETFNLFSDYESKLNHLNRIYKTMSPVGILNMLIGLIYLFRVADGDIGSFYLVNLICGGLLFYGSIKTKQEMNQLKKDKQIYES